MLAPEDPKIHGRWVYIQAVFQVIVAKDWLRVGTVGP